MFDGPASERTKVDLSAMIALVDAVMPPDAARQTMAWRIDAKVAQRTLLHQARFVGEPVTARRAARRAEVLIDVCLALLPAQS